MRGRRPLAPGASREDLDARPDTLEPCPAEARTEVEEYQAGMDATQGTVAGLEPLIGDLVIRVDDLEARVEPLWTATEALAEQVPELQAGR